MSGAGIFISNDPNYVTDYYSARETSEDAKEVLIKYEFDEADIKSGKLQLNESQPEISISKGKVVQVFELELSPRDQVEEMVGDINKIPSPNSRIRYQL